MYFRRDSFIMLDKCFKRTKKHSTYVGRALEIVVTKWFDMITWVLILLCRFDRFHKITPQTRNNYYIISNRNKISFTGSSRETCCVTLRNFKSMLIIVSKLFSIDFTCSFPPSPRSRNVWATIEFLFSIHGSH